MSGVSAQIHGVFVHPGLGFFRCVHAKPLQSCLTLCDSLDGSPPGCSVCGILQARILVGVAIPSPGDLPDPGIETRPRAFRADCLQSDCADCVQSFTS